VLDWNGIIKEKMQVGMDDLGYYMSDVDK
jgi:hypothetical protein